MMVAINGLPMGVVTEHAVHIHLGSCASPYSGMHLTSLGLLIGAGSGAGRLVAPIAPVYLSTGHYVIVYSTSAPQTIIACADVTSP